MKWAATSFLVSGATIVSFFPHLAFGGAWVFSLFLIGHIIWSIYAYTLKEKSLLFLNIGFIPIDFYAMVVRI